MALTAMAFSAQAQTTNICDRTPQVVAQILNVTPANDTCDSVLVSELAAGDSGELDLSGKKITSLRSGDFAGIEVDSILLSWNNLTELPTGIFSGLRELSFLTLSNNALTTLPSGAFSGLTKLQEIFLNGNELRELPTDIFSGLAGLERISLNDNQLRELPAGVFSGLAAVSLLRLEDNPGATFRFTVRFEPKALREGFTTASIRLVLREGAPRPVTVPLLATGASLSVNSLTVSSLTLTAGSIQSDVITITRIAGDEPFGLNQGELELGELITDNLTTAYTGFEIVRGPSLTTTSATRVRIRAFLEGALE